MPNDTRGWVGGKLRKEMHIKWNERECIKWRLISSTPSLHFIPFHGILVFRQAHIWSNSILLSILNLMHTATPNYCLNSCFLLLLRMLVFTISFIGIIVAKQGKHFWKLYSRQCMYSCCWWGWHKVHRAAWVSFMHSNQTVRGWENVCWNKDFLA